MEQYSDWKWAQTPPFQASDIDEQGTCDAVSAFNKTP